MAQFNRQQQIMPSPEPRALDKAMQSQGYHLTDDELDAVCHQLSQADAPIDLAAYVKQLGFDSMAIAAGRLPTRKAGAQ